MAKNISKLEKAIREKIKKENDYVFTSQLFLVFGVCLTHTAYVLFISRYYFDAVLVSLIILVCIACYINANIKKVKIWTS